jgi:hypothetical protein
MFDSMKKKNKKVLVIIGVVVLVVITLGIYFYFKHKKSALSGIGKISIYFDVKKVKTIDNLKKQYKELAKKYHPDAGGSKEDMQAVNNEYELLLDKILTGQNLTEEEKEVERVVNEAFREVIQEIINYPGIDIELIGRWIWVSGATYPIRDVLKKSGFWYASKKKMWYWHPPDAKSQNREEMSIDEIRERYGSKLLSELLPKRKQLQGVNLDLKINNLQEILSVLPMGKMIRV